MSKPLPEGMIEAARLTRAGRLNEATALLQRLLRGEGFVSSPSEGDVAATVIQLPPPTGDVAAVPDDGAPAHEKSTAQDRAPGLAKPLRGVYERAQALRRGLNRSPPAAAEVVPSVGNFVAKAFGNDAGSRVYKLYIPSRHEGEPRPLIVMLHGCTQSPDDFAAGTRMNFAAEQNNCFVAYPEQTAAANSSKCWNWFKSGDQQRGRGEPALIAGIARQVMAEHPIDPCRVYIAGLSAGGAAAAIVGEAYPDLFAAVGVHSGLACGVARDLPSAFSAMRGQHPAPAPTTAGQTSDAIQVPTIVFHGDQDTTVHPRNGVEVVARARAGGHLQTIVEYGSVAAGHSYTRSIQSDVGGRALIEEWVVHGAGHAWSGGHSAGSFTDTKGPDATKEMLRFFLEHVRKAQGSS